MTEAAPKRRSNRLPLLIVVLVVLVAGLVAVVLPALNPSWNTYSSDAGKFSVLIPGTVEEKDSTAGQNGKTLTTNVPNARYSITYFDFPTSIGSGADYVSAMQSTLEGSLGGKAENLKDVKVGEASGVQFKIDETKVNQQALVTLLATKTRMYIISAEFATGKYSQADAEKFANSFALK